MARYCMSEINNPRAWVEKAEEDFVLANSALRRKKPLITGACFHAQQCAEKYLPENFWECERYEGDAVFRVKR